MNSMAEKTKAQLEQEMAEMRLVHEKEMAEMKAKLETPDPNATVENFQLEELKKQLDEANAKLAAKEEDDGVKPAVDTSPEEIKAWLNEKVPFRAFKDDGKYKDDIVAGVTGNMFIIRRGEQTLIPRYLAIQLESSERQMNESANLTQGLADEYKKKSRDIE